MAAAGVAFLLLVALNRCLRKAGWYARAGVSEPNLLQWLDLVALGTICDVASADAALIGCWSVRG